jgi:DNA repair protein RecN (Recombination protein N)
VRESFRRARQLEDTFDALTSKEERLREQRELLEFQIGEIAKADPKEGEEEALEREEKIQRHCEKIFQVSERVHDLLYSGEGSVEEKATSAQALLQDLSSVDAVFGDWARSCEEAKILLGEMLRALSAYTGKIEFQPQRLEEIRERLALLGRLKKKYGGSLDRMIEFRKNAEASVREADSCADEITRTREALERERAALAASCAELSASRRSAADALERSIGAALSELGLSGGSFRVDLRRRPVTDGGVDLEGQRFAVSATGIDLAEFYIALNPGEPMKPLAQVASGGEVSRIMLALKSVLATADSVPVLIFDEIDTGISGRIAHVVGRKLKALGQIHQVVCITHLPQIASLADRHYSVEKTVSAGRTYTSVRPLENEDRIREIAKLIGGETVTESALSSARELVRAQ